MLERMNKGGLANQDSAIFYLDYLNNSSSHGISQFA